MADAERDPVAERDPEVAEVIPPVAVRRLAWLRLAMLAVLLVGVALVVRWLGLHEYGDSRRIAEAIHGLRRREDIAPLFVAAYGIGSTFGLPAAPFTLAGGAIFGAMLGVALNWLGAFIGAAGSYFLARWLGHGALADVIRRRAPRLDALVAEGGFGALLRLRLIPVMPFNALSIGAGLAGVRPLPYLAATAIGILPAIVGYTIFADALLAGAEGARTQAFVRMGLAAAGMLALSFVPTLLARRKRS